MEAEALAEAIAPGRDLRGHEASAAVKDAEQVREEVYAFDGWGMVPLEFAAA